MVFLVVQWEGENSVSTISESKVVLTDQSAEDDLKEGMTVQVLVGKTSKGKSTLYQATVLKIFASQSKALEYEKSLTTKPAENDDDFGKGKPKRNRKPSKKAMEDRENGERDVNEADKENDKPKALKNKATSSGEDEQPCKKQRTKAPKRKDVGGKSNAEKEIVAEQNKLQKSVQQVRVNNILQQRQPTTVIPHDSPSTPPLPQVPLPLQESHMTHTVASSHSPKQQSPATHTTISMCHTSRPSQSPPSSAYTTTSDPCTIPQSKSSPSISYQFPLTHAVNSNHHTITPSRAGPSTSPIPRHFETPQFHTTPRPQQFCSSTFRSLLESEDDLEFEELNSRPVWEMPNHNASSEWQSFTAHFTQQFELLKAEVDGLRAELKAVKKTVRELKANPKNASAPAAGTMATEDPESKFLAVIQNTTKPLEGLKVLLYQLFTADEVRQSSLKGRTTVAGGESVGLQREKLELIYCVMLKKYGTERAAVDNFIRGQQRKLREQFKKRHSGRSS